MPHRSHPRVNDEIRSPEVRLVGPDGTQRGVVTVAVALAEASEAGLDLVEVAPDAAPPVCKILDFGKYLFELSVHEKEARHKQAKHVSKEVRVGANIDEHDLLMKIGQVRKFLGSGANQVKVTLRFRGREVTHAERGRAVMDKVRLAVLDLIGPETPAVRLDGKTMSMVLTPPVKH